MAGLRDADGTVVIDEQEAHEDMKNILAAMRKLQEAMELIDPAKLDDARMLGRARDALNGQFQRIHKKLTGLSENCEKTSQFIGQTIAKYRQIDRDIAKAAKGG
jgi:uncharacterized protein YukE